MAWPGLHNDPAPDVIGGGGEKAGLFARWPWLKRSAIITAPLLAAAVVATAAVLFSGSRSTPPAHSPLRPVHDDQSLAISSKMYDRVQAGGTFAGGSVAGHIWQMAVQNIAVSSGQCQPAVTVNGMDAAPLYPGPVRATPVGDPAFMAPGASMPGAGFAFVKVPAGTTWVWLDPATAGDLRVGMQPVTVASCGEQFRLVGFAYPLAATLRIHESFPAATKSYTVSAALSNPRPTLNDPQVNAVWQDTDTAHARVTTATLTAGLTFGQRFSIRVALGTGGDCFTLSTAYIDDSVNAKPEVAALCGPVSTRQGPETIMALPLGPPAYGGLGVGYAVSVSPGMGRLTAHLSDGRVVPLTPATVAGRMYAAFFVSAPAHLTALDWYGPAGQELALIAGAADLQGYGYAQFSPDDPGRQG